MDHHAVLVDIADLEMKARGESQPERVNGPKIGAIVKGLDRFDPLMGLDDGEDVGECLFTTDASALECGPITGSRMRIEELDTGISDGERCRSELAFIFKI